MIRILDRASEISIAATLLVTLLGTAGSGAAAEPSLSPTVLAGSAVPAVPNATIGIPLEPNGQPSSATDAAAAPSPAQESPAQNSPAPGADTPPAVAASSLEQLVAARVDAGETTDQLKCLAGAIYFEARSESLEGQLAVGRVIVARTRSGRFPSSYCGVVYQHSQFSFIHRQTMPSVNAHSPSWQRAVALARIADANYWQSPAEGALFFHAASVTTNWRAKRIAQIDHHIFYR